MAVVLSTSTITAQAFRLMEMSPISSFADESEQAQSAKEQYPEALTQCLEANDWSFASTVATLPEASLPVDADLPYSYVRPGNFVRLIRVQPDGIAWRLDADAIRSDQSGGITIRYSLKIENEKVLPSLFKNAVAYRLAALLAPRWTTSKNRTEFLARMADDALAKAKFSDRNSASNSRYDGRDREADIVGDALR